VAGILKDPPLTRAFTYHAPSVAKRFDTTPEALRAVIGQIPFILT